MRIFAADSNPQDKAKMNPIHLHIIVPAAFAALMIPALTAHAQTAVTDRTDARHTLTARPDSTYLRPAPLAAYGYRGWLHRGLNVNLDLSVFAQFGKHARSGAGFTQSLSATYLHPLGRHVWIAAGGYADHTVWGGDHYTSGGLYGEVGYQFDKHWAAYIYGRKTIAGSGVQAMGLYRPYDLYGWHDPVTPHGLGDKLGAAVRWTPNPTLSVEVSVEKNWYPSSSYGYADQYKYNYPIPQP